MTPFVLMLLGVAMIAYANQRRPAPRPSYSEEMEREALNMRAKNIAHSHGDPNWWDYVEDARDAIKKETSSWPPTLPQQSVSNPVLKSFCQSATNYPPHSASAWPMTPARWTVTSAAGLEMHSSATGQPNKLSGQR